jgi:hypothetical protein
MEATVTLLKPASVAFAAASLFGLAALAPAQAQTGYPGPQTSYAAPGDITELVTNGPQSNIEARQPNWSPQQNLVQSRRYTRLVETDPAFRDARMRKECGPVTDPQLREECVASFPP